MSGTGPPWRVSAAGDSNPGGAPAKASKSWVDSVDSRHAWLTSDRGVYGFHGSFYRTVAARVSDRGGCLVTASFRSLNDLEPEPKLKRSTPREELAGRAVMSLGVVILWTGPGMRFGLHVSQSRFAQTHPENCREIQGGGGVRRREGFLR
jgi:hypothetical protein